MKQTRHPLATLFGGLIQGLFRAGHLALIALGVFALSQILPAPGTALKAGPGPARSEPIDALGGADSARTLPAAYTTAPAWWQQAGNQLHDALQAFTALPGRVAGIANEAVEAPAPASIDGPPALSSDWQRLSSHLAARYRVSDDVLATLLLRAQQVGKETHIDPLLIVSVMAVESSFNPLAESRFGAQGLMQVIPKYHMDKLDDDAGHLALFEPETNIRVGALVLKEYLRRTGSIESALQTYAGAADDEEMGYTRKVLGTRERLVQAMRG